jgi:hypothetical protein
VGLAHASTVTCAGFSVEVYGTTTRLFVPLNVTAVFASPFNPPVWPSVGLLKYVP